MDKLLSKSTSHLFEALFDSIDVLIIAQVKQNDVLIRVSLNDMYFRKYTVLCTILNYAGQIISLHTSEKEGEDQSEMVIARFELSADSLAGASLHLYAIVREDISSEPDTFSYGLLDDLQHAHARAIQSLYNCTGDFKILLIPENIHVTAHKFLLQAFSEVLADISAWQEQPFKFQLTFEQFSIFKNYMYKGSIDINLSFPTLMSLLDFALLYEIPSFQKELQSQICNRLCKLYLDEKSFLQLIQKVTFQDIKDFASIYYLIDIILKDRYKTFHYEPADLKHYSEISCRTYFNFSALNQQL